MLNAFLECRAEKTEYHVRKQPNRVVSVPASSATWHREHVGGQSYSPLTTQSE